MFDRDVTYTGNNYYSYDKKSERKNILDIASV